MMKSRVILHLYDISNGVAKAMSQSVIGKQIDGIWHTGVSVYGVEYFYGGGIQKCHPSQIVANFGIRPIEEIDLGETELGQETFEEFLKTVESKYSSATYDIFTNNCNNFSDEAVKFLLGSGIPNHIIDLPNEFLRTPIGQTIAPLMNSLNSKMLEQMIPFSQQTLDTTSSKENLQGHISKGVEGSENNQKVQAKFELSLKITASNLENMKLCFKNEDPTIREVKEEIRNRTGYGIEEQRIIYAGSLLKVDSKRLSELGIKHGYTIHMSPKLGAKPKVISSSQKPDDSNQGTRSMDAIVEEIARSPVKDRKLALRTLLKIIQNIIDHPNDPKYRKIRKNNPAIQKRLNPVSASFDLLRIIGFEEVSEGGEALMTLQATAEGWERLVDAKDKILASIDGMTGSGGTGNRGVDSMSFPTTAAGTGLPQLDSNNPLLQGMRRQILNNPEMLRNMLNSPMMAQMAQGNPHLEQTIRHMRENPEALRSMVNNPMFQAMQQELERNPQLAQTMMQNMMNNQGISSQSMQGFPNSISPVFQGSQQSQRPVQNSSNQDSQNSRNTDNDDAQMTEEEMLQEAIRRSLQEQ